GSRHHDREGMAAERRWDRRIRLLWERPLILLSDRCPQPNAPRAGTPRFLAAIGLGELLLRRQEGSRNAPSRGARAEGEGAKDVKVPPLCGRHRRALSRLNRHRSLPARAP